MAPLLAGLGGALIGLIGVALGSWLQGRRVSRAGLVPVVALAQRAGLGDLAGEHLWVGHRCGVNPQVKVPAIVAGGGAGGAGWRGGAGGGGAGGGARPAGGGGGGPAGP